MTRVLRKPARRAFRALIRVGPASLRRAAARLPYSRAQWTLRRWFDGDEDIVWRGLQVRVNPGDVHGFYPYFLGVYAEEEIDRLTELCRGESVFADVGANTGLLSLALAQAHPQLDMYAFEADRDVAARLRANVALNPNLASRFHVHEAAVSDGAGTVRFQPSGEGLNSETGRVAADGAGYAVAAVSLDDYFEPLGRDPGVVKIDVEGHEVAVLHGMRRLLSRGVPSALLIELHPCYFEGPALETYKAQVWDFLRAHFRELHVLAGNRLQPLPEPGAWPSRLHVIARI